MSDQNAWSRCNTCKRPIGFDTIYYVCSVSTCNKRRSPYRFCSVDCWDAHVPVAGHRSATAVEERSPKSGPGAGNAGVVGSESDGPRRRVLGTGTGSGVGVAAREAERAAADKAARRSSSELSAADVLVVASRLKTYIRAQSGMNTSDTVLGPLSEHLRKLAHYAIRNARADGRKTVMDRDVPPVVEPL